MDNLIHDLVDSRARVLFGMPRPSCMVQGISRGDALAVFVGYHAGAGAEGVLSHTFSSNFTEVRVNGAPMTEAEVNGLYAASYGVPVGVVTGDDRICEVAQKVFAGVTTVETKTALGWSATDSLQPSVACDRIEAAVASAVRDAGALPRPSIPDAFELDVDFATVLGADYATSVPRSVRLSPRTVRLAVDDVADLVGGIMSFYFLSAFAAQQLSAVANRR
jgi:D-amino peptidase